MPGVRDSRHRFAVPGVITSMMGISDAGSDGTANAYMTVHVPVSA